MTLHPRRLRLQNIIALQAAASIAKPEHPVSDIDIFPVREPVSGRAWVAVRVKTASGHTGWGEAARVAPSDLVKARSAIAGKPATAWATLRSETPLDGAINMALLDIAGRVANAPVYRLLGGPTRFKVRALTTLEGASDGELTEALRRGLASGYQAFQVPIPQTTARNQGQAFAKAVLQRMEKLRSAAPESVNFVLGASGKLTPGDASVVTATLESFHLLWFDEPSAVSNLRTLRKISDESVTPLAFGAAVEQPAVYQDLLREGVADLLRPDLHTNGLSGIRRIGVLAETYYVAVAPNHQGGPIATAAALHLAASMPNFFIQHVPLPAADQDRKMRSQIVTQAVETVRDGFLQLTTSPGLGVEVNTAALDQYKDHQA